MPLLPLPKREATQSKLDSLYLRLKDVYIPTRDGSELCADIFLPLSVEQDVKVPVLLSMCPYGKDVHALEWGLPQTDIYAKMNAKIKPVGPDAGFEALDPLLWTKEFGYALIRIDCRGAGGTPGMLDPFGLQRTLQSGQDAEGNDLYDAIEWAARQSWCNGKVGMSGISYLGMACWWAAQQNPPSLKAVVPWEAGTHWWKNCVLPYQHGRSEGVSEDELQSHRVDFLKYLSWEFRSDGSFPILDRFRRFDNIKIPFYSAANYMDTEVHAPGNILGYMWGTSQTKYLETHTGDHLHAFYSRDGIDRQRRFLDHFLKDDGKSLQGIPKVDLLVRKGARTYRRAEQDFPPYDTEYKEYFLTSDGQLLDEYPGSNNEIIVEYTGLSSSKLFSTKPLDKNFELLGFPYMVLDVATTAKDMDLFITMTNMEPNGHLVQLEGNHGEPSVAVTRGYLRLSHRELDEQRSTEHLVILSHQSSASVEPDTRYQIKVPVQATSMVFEKGHKIQIELGSRDSDTLLDVMKHQGFDRTIDRFGGKNTIFKGSKIILPFVRRIDQ
ncbi:Alpha/Beta hydrolase protein [Talaromyces proteolyticus]|uniref:Alpha/Beta hydrolase protein n=1 Tax=Talaromyces proteolyticus TaxID=1131652 RepID=A0AAD4KJ57_9EURO|nr:Alpha/Beta hydrolase protein [Talaromyces proteolyticus]KAH8693586.1 Alpha/Beta hydrolase protein [Talaromyces proteolyticus]